VGFELQEQIAAKRITPFAKKDNCDVCHRWLADRLPMSFFRQLRDSHYLATASRLPLRIQR
jgi:hypothetical protein